MAQFQYQEQEDLMADFDLPARKEVHKYSARDDRRKSRNSPSYKKKTPRPTLKPNFFKQTRAREAAKKSTHINESTHISGNTKKSAESAKVVTEASNNVLSGDWGFDDGFDDFSPESFYVLFEEVKMYLTTKADVLRNLGSVDAARESCSLAFNVFTEYVQEVPKYEEELQYLTAAALVSYGGSWTSLAGILAAVEAFGTEKVIDEGWKVGTIFFSDDLEQDDVSPAEIKETFRKLGLQMALLIAVMVSPSWAEICITVAFASKFSSLIPVQRILKSTMARPNELGCEPGELDEYFSIVDDSWFDLLAVIASNIVSLTLFGCFPRLITAMYMGYLGASIAMECFMNRADSYEFEWLKSTTQYYVWGVVAVMSLWQALTAYNGICVFLSWLMFLHPVVQVYNMLTADDEETKNMKVE